LGFVSANRAIFVLNSFCKVKAITQLEKVIQPSHPNDDRLGRLDKVYDGADKAAYQLGEIKSARQSGAVSMTSVHLI